MSDEPERKKVLVITYYWPPSGGSGVQRWLKFVKYLPKFGWQPYVFTPENPSFDLRDESLLKDVPPEAEVLHFPIWEPYSIFHKLSGNKGKVPQANSVPRPDSLFKKISIWIRGNFFIPDPRVFWVRPSVSFLNDFLKEQKIRTIITTGPPHSMHLIGLRLKKKNPSLRWIADFRDPWSEWGFLETLPLSFLAKKLHLKLEQNVLQNASVVLTVTPSWVKMFEKLSGKKVHLLTNGYDEDDFRKLSPQQTDKFVVRHVGTVNEKCNPIPFMEAVASLCRENDEFKRLVHIDFVGDVKTAFKSFITSHSVLCHITTFTNTVPHERIMELYGESSVLLLVLTGYKDPEGLVPGKLFEYIATGLPVLGIGVERGDAANLINELQYGVMVSEKSPQKIKSELLALFDAWRSRDNRGDNKKEKYSRRVITKQLIELLT